MIALFSFWPFLAQRRGAFLRAFALSLLTLSAGLALLGVSGWFLTAAALTTAGVAFNLFAPSAGVRGISFIRILSRYGERVSGHDATLRLLSDLRRWIFARLFVAIPLPGAGLHRADLVNRLVSDVDSLDNALLTALLPMAGAVVVGVAMTAGLAAAVPAAALPYGLCFVAMSLGVPLALARFSQRMGRETVAAGAELRLAVLQGLDLHQELVAFDQTRWAIGAADAAACRLEVIRRRLARLTAAATAVSQIVASVAVAAVLIAGIDALQHHRLDGPILVAILLAVVASFEAIGPLVRGAGRFSAAAAAAERLKSIADLNNPIASPTQPKAIPSGGRLTLEHVSFGYGAPNAVLRDVSLDIASGERVAIVGPSGSGKSTLASLLVHLADPSTGAVRLNGVDLKETAPAELNRRIALMTQDAPVFNDTIRNNLLIGEPTADDRRLWLALTAVGLDDAIRQLPRGLGTMLGEAGSGLSTGQSRRIALARTLLSQADVIILDEPTSGLDRPAEEAFFAGLGAIGEGRTLVVITHADLPAGSVDVTYALRDGELAARPPA